MKILLSESTYNLIMENPIYMKQNEIPFQIVNWAKQKIGNVRLWKVRQKGSVSVSGAWHEYTTNYYGVFHLSNGDYIKTKEFAINGKENVSGSQSIEIPSGYLVVILDTKTSSADIYTAPDALKLISDNSLADELTDEQLMALYEAKSLKSFARFKFKESVYEALIVKGLLAKNKSITVEGRNLITSIPRSKMQEVVDRLNLIYSKAPHYKHFYA